MIAEIRHYLSGCNTLAFAEGKIRRGCWECCNKADIHHKGDPMVSKCIVDEHEITNPYVVPDWCKEKA